MGTTATPNPTTVKQSPLTRSVYNLDDMEEVTLVKSVPDFVPVTSTQEALHRLGNDAKAFLQVINDGLKDQERESVAGNSEIPWMEESEDGTQTAFTGTPADGKKVKTLILTLAKTIFGYGDKSQPIEQKRAAKASALAMIQSNEQIKSGLKNSAAGTL